MKISHRLLGPQQGANRIAPTVLAESEIHVRDIFAYFCPLTVTSRHNHPKLLENKVTEDKTEEVRTWASTARAHVGGKPETTCAVSVKGVPPHPSTRMHSKGSRTRLMNRHQLRLFHTIINKIAKKQYCPPRIHYIYEYSMSELIPVTSSSPLHLSISGNFLGKSRPWRTVLDVLFFVELVERRCAGIPNSGSVQRRAWQISACRWGRRQV